MSHWTEDNVTPLTCSKVMPNWRLHFNGETRSIVGASLVITITDALFNTILAVMMILTVLFIIWKPKTKSALRADSAYSTTRKPIGVFAFFLIGVYSGFIQAGGRLFHDCCAHRHFWAIAREIQRHESVSLRRVRHPRPRLTGDSAWPSPLGMHSAPGPEVTSRLLKETNGSKPFCSLPWLSWRRVVGDFLMFREFLAENWNFLILLALEETRSFPSNGFLS